jgi:hypothetical protein
VVLAIGLFADARPRARRRGFFPPGTGPAVSSAFGANMTAFSSSAPPAMPSQRHRHLRLMAFWR